MVFNNILETIGNTPLVRLNRLVSPDQAEVLCKIESFNPMHSVKDRIALAMIEDAERRGELSLDSVVVEPTSGNTGIGLAMVCAVRRYRLIITMPESMTPERRRIMKALGAEIVLTPASLGMRGAIQKAQEIADAERKAFIPQQFKNPSNPRVHYERTAREILQGIDSLDAFVAGVGTGGTITGVGRALKEKSDSIRIVAVEPDLSAVLSGGRPGSHLIQGIGAGFIPEILDLDVIDSIIRVTDDEAISMARELARSEGILGGISSGAAVHAALEVATELGKGKRVVTVLPDSGDKYLSTELFPE